MQGGAGGTSPHQRHLPGTGSITKDKRSMPLTSSKNLSKTNTDLCKMSVTDTHFYLNPLGLNSKTRLSPCCPTETRSASRWLSDPPSPSFQPQTKKSSHPAFSCVSFPPSCSPIILGRLLFPKPSLCFPAPAVPSSRQVSACGAPTKPEPPVSPSSASRSSGLMDSPSYHLALLLPKSCYSLLNCYYSCSSPVVF